MGDAQFRGDVVGNYILVLLDFCNKFVNFSVIG